MTNSLSRTLNPLKFIALAALINGAVNVQAGAREDAADALTNCIRAFKQEIGGKNFVALDRTYAISKEGRDYRYFLNAVNKHPELPKAQEYRAECTSGGFAKFRTIEVTNGRWAFKNMNETRQQRVVVATY